MSLKKKKKLIKGDNLCLQVVLVLCQDKNIPPQEKKKGKDTQICSLNLN